MHRRLTVPMLPLRVWVHCPRASNGLLPPRSYLVGYMRWHARSDSTFSSFRQSFRQLSGRRVDNLPWFGFPPRQLLLDLLLELLLGHFPCPVQPGCTVEVLPVPPGQLG